MIRRPRSCRVVFDGQSRMAFPTWDGFGGYSWGRLAMAGRGLPGYLVAVSGQSITDLMADFATRVAPKLSGPEPSIYVMGDVGPSDIVDEGDSAATVYSQAGQLAGMARAAGADYVLCASMLPGDPYFDPSHEAIRLSANALLLADASDYFDATVDICVGELLNTSNQDVYADGLHVYGPWPIEGWGSGLGTPLVADIVSPYIDAAIAAVT